ncbi:MAG TPA: MFS transporter [Gaiellaceae bacterium]|nr:MFS transporter [Gaiellaceae bacterium]
MTGPERLLAPLTAALRNADVRRVELAWGAAIAAEWAHFVALGVYAYDAAGATGVGLAGLVRLLPAALIAPFAASLGDRFRRERFLLAMALIGTVALAASAAAAFVGSQALVFGLAAVVGLSATLTRPALQALLPSLARTPEELIAANAATSTIESLGTLAGPIVAGVLVALADVGVVFVVGAATLLVGAGLLARVRVEGRVDLASPERHQAMRMLVAGFRAIARAPRTRLLIGLVVAQTFVRGCLNVLIVITVFQVLDGGGAEVGYLTAAIGVGGLLGGLGAMALEGRRLAFVFGLALVFWGAPLVLLAPQPSFVAAVVLLAVVGAANSVEDVAVFTLLQRLVPDDVLTRVLGVVWGLAMGAVALGSIAAPVLVKALGARAAFAAVGAILPLLAILTYRRLVEIDRAVAPAAEVDLVKGVPMFAPLSIAAKERVAANLIPVAVAAGDTVIRSGEVGDRFYVVGSGALDIDAPGHRLTAGAGDYFGEIALLRDIPRTATVTASADSVVYALERDDFLAVVTGHSAADAAGREVVDARMAAAR